MDHSIQPWLWFQDGAERLGPYCQRCYESERLLVRLDVHEAVGHCRVCDTMFASMRLADPAGPEEKKQHFR
jgi:hypothetical protein